MAKAMSFPRKGKGGGTYHRRRKPISAATKQATKMIGVLIADFRSEDTAIESHLIEVEDSFFFDDIEDSDIRRQAITETEMAMAELRIQMRLLKRIKAELKKCKA